MHSIPKPALWLGLAGLIPFVFGAVISLGGTPDVPENSYPLIIPQDGLNILASYGVVILSFMSGALWGFATSPEKEVRSVYLALSVVPALYCFFYAWSGPLEDRIINLLFGFIGILFLDYLISIRGLVPDWWMSLRTMLTAIACICLAIGGLI